MTHPAFLQDICEHPEDDGPRLIYADWLDDHGDSDRAEFIRTQVELARLDEEDERRQPLAERETQLLAEHESAWRSELPAFEEVWWGGFSRGFVAQATVARAAGFLRHGAALCSATPLEELRLMELGSGEAVALAAAGVLGRVSTLLLYQLGFGDDVVRTLAASPYLERFREL
jgi:uncharacterized protein (TIGR02996 family)